MRIEKVGNLQNVENIFPSSKTPVDYPTQRTLICIPLYLYFSVVSWQISKLQEKQWKSSTKTLFHRFGNFAWFYRLFWTFPIAQMVKISIVFSEDPLILPSGVLKNPIHLQSFFISNLVYPGVFDKCWAIVKGRNTFCAGHQKPFPLEYQQQQLWALHMLLSLEN